VSRSTLILLLIFAAGSGCATAMAAPFQQTATASDKVKLDAAERRRVVDAAIANIKQHYFDSHVAQETADALLEHEKAGEYDAAADGESLAALLTQQMRDSSRDMHLELIYSQEPLPEHRREPAPEDLERFRKRLEQQNCLIEKIEILPHNIGYFKLNWFADPAACAPQAKAAMASLNNADAVIFDLRDDRGGDPQMVALIASYLFDHPEYWYSPREAPTESSWTRSPVEGNKLADKPVYVLTSHLTLSGAEQFTYDLKMLRRATIVGETTGGGAHAGVFHRIDDHFGIAIPEVRAVNPYGKNDWEGTGVEPDVKVKAADALEVAKKLAQSRLKEK
jgi:hypothetical protein